MKTVMMAGAALAGALWLSGCATEDYVNQHTAVVQTQVDALHSTVQDHETRITAADKTAREALARAEAAGKLAEGKFLYSVVLSDDSIKFRTADSELSDEAKSRLGDLAGKLKTDNRNVYLEIQGYTDSTGAPARNLELGNQRAEAVRRFLNTQGVALNRMATISYGQDNPIANNDTREGRAQNRRVVVMVMD